MKKTLIPIMVTSEEADVILKHRIVCEFSKIGDIIENIVESCQTSYDPYNQNYFRVSKDAFDSELQIDDKKDTMCAKIEYWVDDPHNRHSFSKKEADEIFEKFKNELRKKRIVDVDVIKEKKIYVVSKKYKKIRNEKNNKSD